MAKSKPHKNRSKGGAKTVKGKGSSAKGGQGKKTGPKTRKAIRDKLKQGATLEEIGMAVGRDDSTIGAILNGVVKNPPNGLAGKIRSIKVKKKK